MSERKQTQLGYFFGGMAMGFAFMSTLSIPFKWGTEVPLLIASVFCAGIGLWFHRDIFTR